MNHFSILLALLLFIVDAKAQEVIVVLRKGDMSLNGKTIPASAVRHSLIKGGKIVLGNTASGYAFIKGQSKLFDLKPRQRWTGNRLYSAIKASEVSLTSRFSSLLLDRDLENGTGRSGPNYGGVSRGGEGGVCIPADGDTLLSDTACFGFACLTGTPSRLYVFLNNRDTLYGAAPSAELHCLPARGVGDFTWRVILRNGSTGHTGRFYKGDEAFTRQRLAEIEKLKAEVGKLDPETQEELLSVFLMGMGWRIR